MKRLTMLLFFAILFGYKNNNNDSGIIIESTDTVSSDFTERRQLNNFRNSSQRTYSILFDNLPSNGNIK